MTSPLIQATNLCYAYPGQDPDSSRGAALRNISFSLPAGALLCLGGVNGCGKSTLLTLLAGLAGPDNGELVIQEHRAPGRERDIRACTALCMQEPDVQILGPTPREDLALCLKGRDSDNTGRIEDMARRFGLEHCLDEPVHTLSGGQKRKLCLATALLSRDERRGGGREEGQGKGAVLLLDEPCSGLDYPAIREMRGILADNKARGLTQILTTHDLEPLLDLADILGLMDRGRLVHFGAPMDVLPFARECGVRPPCGWKPGEALPAWE